MRLLLRFCASCAFLRPSLLVLFAAFAGHLAAQPAPVLADPTTGALYRPGAATFASYNNLLTLDGAAGSYLLISTAASTYLPITVAFNSYQQLDADLTSWAAVVRAGGFDTFVATPSSANLATLVTGETGSGALVFGTSPTFTTPISNTLTAATGQSLTLTGGDSGASLVLGSVANGSAYYSSKGAGYHIFSTAALKATAATNTLATWSSADATPSTLVAEFTGSATGSARTVSLFGYDAAVGGLSMILQRAGGNVLIGTTTDATSLAGGLVINGSGAGATSTTTARARCASRAAWA